ncbi:hypothetical protein ACFOOP_00155 [Marinicaulis aureus]|uniref:DUF551 domain-containing protein n=1 Tax=Hyphococcus aureus TaxID=2666033 RepID=A0ABW1KZJ6_9PROT
MGIFRRLAHGKKETQAPSLDNSDEQPKADFIRADEVGPRPAARLQSKDYHVVFDGGDGSYSIAIGTWNPDPRISNSGQATRTLLFRWNGPSKSDSGIPNSTQPDWMPLPKEFAYPILDHIADMQFDHWWGLLDGEE